MRYILSFLLLILCACSSAPKPFEIPKAVEGGWKIASQGSISPAPAEWLDRIGLTRSQSATYAGPIEITAEFYEFKADSAAFECKQRWRPVKGEDQFYTRNLFVVVKSPHPNKEMLMDFSRALQKSL